MNQEIISIKRFNRLQVIEILLLISLIQVRVIIIIVGTFRG